MLKNIPNIVFFTKNILSKEGSRSVKTFKNILSLFLLKGGGVIVGLLLIPMTIDYVEPIKYGIWLTLNSLITWFSFFDAGLANGLRTKLGEAISKNDDYLAKTYISTAYVIIAIISLTLFIIFNIANNFINWSIVLNVPKVYATELKNVSLVLFSIFTLQFILQLINIICLAKQSAMIVGLISFLSSLLSILTVFTLTKTTDGSLINLCYSTGASPLIILFIFTIILFKGPYKKYRPSFNFVELSYAKNLLRLGVKFFIIQIGLLFFYNTGNLVITQVIGADAVTPYNIAFKYFGTITTLSGIIMTPFWVAFTEANINKDYVWIKRTVRQLEVLFIGVFSISILLLIVSEQAYEFWIGRKIHVPFSLSCVMCVYVSINTYRTIFNSYVNGTGKIRLQMLLILASGVVNVPLSIYLGKLFNITGVILSSTLICILCSVFEVIQYRKLIANRASGIWNK